MTTGFCCSTCGEVYNAGLQCPRCGAHNRHLIHDSGEPDQLGKPNGIDATIDLDALEAAPPFQRVLEELLMLHERKSLDYGSDSDPYANLRASEGFGIAPWLGAILRLNDKITRIQSFAKRGTLANESLRDSLQDICVYSVIALLLYDEAESGVE